MNTYDTRYMELVETKLRSVVNKEKKVTEMAKELTLSRQTIHKWLIRY